MLLLPSLSLLLAALLSPALATIPRACSTPETSGYPFCNPALPLDDRIHDLISRLTLEEKPYLLTARESPLGNISRLGIPEYDWGGNCIHGVQSRCGTRCPTSFPNPNHLGATFNRSVWLGMGHVIGVEVRSLWLQGVGENHGSNLPHFGLDCWSPNIEVVRDIRWGRNMETPSEDPLINGLYGALYSVGLQQGDDPRFLQAIATLKHYDANSLEGNWGPGGSITRHTADPTISLYDLASTYLLPFAYSVVQGQAQGVMCSYNSINGVPSCANSFLLQSVLRDGWGFDGYVTSDSGAVEDILNTHHYVTNASEAVADAIRAGCDIISASWPKDQPWSTGGWYIQHAADAIASGLMTEADLDAVLFRALKMRFRLGLFDPIDDQPYWHVPPEAVRSEANVAAAQEATAQGLVLLQNPDSILPLKTGQTLAVIGPLAKAQGVLLGNYLGQICPGNNTDDYSCVQTPFDALQAANVGAPTLYAQGLSSVTSNSTLGFHEAVAAAQKADAAILFVGLDLSVESEGRDRHSIVLPGAQQKLIDAIVAVGKPVTVVLFNGGAVAIDELKAARVAVIEAWYPGFYGAQALSDAIFGVTNTWGKLPITIFNSNYTNEFDMLDFNMSTAPGRTYRYYTRTPLYPFGFGLSYTSFALSFAAAPAAQLPATFSITVTNTGGRAGDEVVMAFFAPLDVPAGEPAAHVLKQLFDFQRVTVGAGAEAKLAFSVTADQLALTDSQGDRVLYPGRYRLVFTNGAGSEVEALVQLAQGGVVSHFPHIV